jgi:prophage maintenance system killer protein
MEKKMRSRISNYIWLYVNEKDIKTFNSAFNRTPNLFCNNEIYLVKCSAVSTAENNIHDHCDIWNINDEDITFIHETNYGPFWVKVHWQKIEINEEFVKYLINLTFEAHELAKKIKEEGLYGEVSKGAVEGTIYALAHKWMHTDNLTILDIASELMFSFACRHKFRNGNKRTALVLGVLFLKFCGLFFLYTNMSEEKYMSFWEDMMIDIVESFTIKKYSEEIVLKAINSKLDNLISISYNSYVL